MRGTVRYRFRNRFLAALTEAAVPTPAPEPPRTEEPEPVWEEPELTLDDLSASLQLGPVAGFTEAIG